VGLRKKIIADSMTLLLAVLIAFLALTLLAGMHTDLENLAKGEQNTSRFETYKGKPFTAYTIKDLRSLILDRVKNGPLEMLGDRTSFHRLLWLGNSQLHYINQFQDGDHLSPYWLMKLQRKEQSLEPLGFSLPNASFQEFLVLSLYVTNKIPVDLIVIELCFDDLREDELRIDFSEILTQQDEINLRKSTPAADLIIGRFFTKLRVSSDNVLSGTVKKPYDILSGTVQKPVENWINSRLTSWWFLWANRSQAEGNMLNMIYNLRNWVFNINPTTIRKMIPNRYSANMNALNSLVRYYSQKGIPVLLYIAPIRQDKSIPYDAVEYEQWKKEVAALIRDESVYLANLESLVPPEYWGSYVGSEIDFMHFRNGGHKLVAKAITPYVEQILARKRS
jgi:hypothetical protein